MHKTDRYSWLQISLHWAIALLIVTNYLFSEGIEDAFDAMMEGTATPSGVQPWLHIYVGLAVLALVLVRLLVRMMRPVALVQTGKPVQDRAAAWGHRLLYVMMVVVPGLGALTWFGQIDATADLHVLAMNGLMLLALGHSAVALFHQFVLKDGLLMRMLRPA